MGACSLVKLMPKIEMLNLAKRIIVVFGLICISSCAKDQDSSDSDTFECTVDYVEFIDDSNAIVKFDTTYEGETRSYYGRYTYEKVNGNYFLGDQMVAIKNFKQNGNEATFIFEYGEQLGFFCATIFEVLPEHTHNNFSAEASKVSTGRSVGRWKIKKKTRLSSTTN